MTAIENAPPFDPELATALAALPQAPTPLIRRPAQNGGSAYLHYPCPSDRPVELAFNLY